LWMRRMRNVEEDVADFRSAFVDQENLILPLHEEKRVNAAHDEKSWDTPGAAARAGLIGTLACRGKLVLLPHLLDGPRLEDRVREVGDSKRYLPALVVVGNVRVILLVCDRSRSRCRRLEIVCNLRPADGRGFELWNAGLAVGRTRGRKRKRCRDENSANAS